MTGKVVGFYYDSYPQKDTGELKEGFHVSVLSNMPKDKVSTGQRAQEVYVSKTLLDNTVGHFELEATYMFDYEVNGKFSKLSDIIKLDTKT